MFILLSGFLIQNFFILHKVISRKVGGGFMAREESFEMDETIEGETISGRIKEDYPPVEHTKKPRPKR